MAEQPPLNRFYVASYAANDRDFPIVAIRLDPRVAGYRVPEDLSPHPDSKRYPNHVFTGSQPSNGDERVTHIYEILPAPWVPFTRYDDDLGPVQGRRRSVKNEGQVATLAADKRVNYEAREGSAIVYTEIEETWSIETDDDGNSLFPVRDRDFYDASRGPVQERRQLFVPTGEEEGSLENVNGVITQTSYEPYNEFLSVKIVQTYSVNGPQLIGKATDNDGQLVTITTQRKGALGYVTPNPTATRTVEVSREDAESLVERIVDTPEVFTAKTFSLERPDPIPQKFRVAVPLQSEQEIIAGEAEPPTLSEGEISRTEEQRNKFIKRTTATSRDQTVLPKTLVQKATNSERQEVTITETLQFGDTNEVPTAIKTVESEALGDGNFVVRKTEVPRVFPNSVISVEKPDNVPQKFRALIPTKSNEESVAGTIETPSLSVNELSKSEQQVTEFVKRIRTIERSSSIFPEEPYSNVGSGLVASNSRRITGAEFVTELGGGYANVIETYPFIKFTDYKTIKPEFGTISDQIEDLGDGTAIRRQVILPKGNRVFDNGQFWTDGKNNYSDETLPMLRGQDYDEELDLVIPYFQVVSEPDNEVLSKGQRRRVTPRDIAHSVVQKYNIEDVQDSLDKYYWEIPDMINISLPNRLKSATLIPEFGEAVAEAPTISGDTYSYSQSKRNSSGGQISYDIEEGFQGTVPTIRAIFFLPKDGASPEQVLARIRQERQDFGSYNSSLGELVYNINFWPNARPESHQVVITAKSNFEEESSSISFDSQATSRSSGANVSVSVATIPPTLHGLITIKQETEPTETEPNNADIGSVNVSPSRLESTSPYARFPTGLFIYQINASPYKFSYTRVDALLVNITNEYV